MLEDFHAFFKKAADEDEPASDKPEAEGEDLLDENEDLPEGGEEDEDLQDLGFTDTEVDPEQANSSFFFNPQKVDDDLKNEQSETTEYKADDKEDQLLKQKTGIDILLEAHRVDWVIKSAYQSLYLFIRDSVKESKTKELVYRIKFTNTPWAEGNVSFDTLSRFNVYYDSFSDAIQKLEPKIEKVQWSPTFQGKDLFLTFDITTK